VLFTILRVLLALSMSSHNSIYMMESLSADIYSVSGGYCLKGMLLQDCGGTVASNDSQKRIHYNNIWLNLSTNITQWENLKKSWALIFKKIFS